MSNELRSLNFSFPPIFSINLKILDNPIRQVLRPGFDKQVSIQPRESDGQRDFLLLDGDETILAVGQDTTLSNDFDKVVTIEVSDQIPEYAAKWIRHPEFPQNRELEEINYSEEIRTVIQSWAGSFSFKTAGEDSNGLRTPQIGAIHAVLAHWTVSEQAVTVVMPTGTGKTETMLSIMIAAQCEKILVVVPTDALRTQLADKFLDLGVLKRVGVLSETARYPIVGILKHKPKTVTEVDTFFEKCNVVVTTMAIGGRCSPEIQERMAYWCPGLFIDEAHHIGAQTWDTFKKKFTKNKIIQFTATPFRNDGKVVGGKIVYNYPLGKAQRDGYFRKINFTPVVIYNLTKADQAIAEKAVAQLRKDREQYNHVLMARVDSIKRAREIFPLYERYPEFRPVVIHTDMNTAEKNRARKAILGGEAKIVICVDMLGEGFDLPELKIAAFHDVKKSLPITLQLAGRFIRTRTDLGEATFIANIGDVSVRDELRKLYSQDADWNLLLQQTSESVIQNQVDLWEFLQGFTNLPEEIAIQNIRPALSTVIYRTQCTTWTPNHFWEGIENPNTLEQIYHDVNVENNVLVIIVGRKTPIDWAEVKEVYGLSWELYIIFWEQEQNLLFINGSGNNGWYKDLAQAIAGDTVELIKGSDVFRAFSGVNRLRLQNVGLLERLSRLINYTMRAGPDVDGALTDAQKQFASFANIFGTGYEDGKRTSVGCSYKGRIWTRKTGELDELIKWCKVIGNKVTDTTINPFQVLAGTLVSEIISVRPAKMPVWINWPEEFYKDSETAYRFTLDGTHQFQLYETELRLVDLSDEGDIRFEMYTDDAIVPMRLTINDEGYQFSVEGHNLSIRHGFREEPIQEFFEDHQPTIYFFDGSLLEGNNYTELKSTYPPYESEKISAWDWTGVNIRRESQGVLKEQDSIQFKVIETLKGRGFDLIYDDDSSGEIADVVAVTDRENAIEMELYHCKFSGEDAPGARIDDLYAVCGQAQKSTSWKDRIYEKPDEIFMHLQRREQKRLEDHLSSRIERGSVELIETLKVKSHSCPIDVKIFIVQPGLSKARASDGQLRLLSVTENYLMETFKLPFGVIASP